jgi:NIMA (never in mitosis gene a)-related kinase
MAPPHGGGSGGGEYHLGAKLGEGSFGTVFKAVRRADSATVVIKQVGLRSLNTAQREEAHREVSLLRSLEHPRVVRYVDSFVDAAGLNIVMEWAARGDLHAKIRSVKTRGKRFTEQAVWRYVLQTAQALSFIHERKVLHRDLKPANIFLDSNGDAKLGDFGVSKLLESTAQLCNTRVGT